MATYKKKLLDSKGNVILPYTRAELVYNGNAKISDQISTLSTNYTNLLNALNQLKTDLSSGAVKPAGASISDGFRISQAGSGATVTTGIFVADGSVFTTQSAYVWNTGAGRAMRYALT